MKKDRERRTDRDRQKDRESETESARPGSLTSIKLTIHFKPHCS
jgi:hypothetical protein